MSNGVACCWISMPERQEVTPRVLELWTSWLCCVMMCSRLACSLLVLLCDDVLEIGLQLAGFAV